MKKTIIATCISFILLAGGAIAATQLADQHLAQIYQSQANIGLLNNFQVHKKDLGFWGGEAEWRANIALDPCAAAPEQSIEIIAKDSIRKSLMGYNIKTTFQFNHLDPKIAQLLNQQLTAETQIKWTGKGSTKLILAPYLFSEEPMSIEWKQPITASFDFKYQDQQLKARNLAIKADQLAIQQPNETVEFSNIRYSSNLPLHINDLETGKWALHIKAIDIQSKAESSKAFIEKFSLNMAQHIRPEKSNLEMLFDINKAHFHTPEYEHFIANEFQVRLSLLDLDTSAIQKMTNILHQASQECSQPEQVFTHLEQPILELLQKGFKVESNHNQLKLGFGELVANGEMTIPARAYTDFETAKNELAEQVQYRATVNFNKLFFKNLLEFTSPEYQKDKDKIEQRWKELAQEKNVTLTDDKFVYEVKQNMP